MKTNHFIGCLLAISALVGCKGEDAVISNTSDRVALQVASGIESRAIGNNWQKDDAIGIFMLQAGQTAISESAENRRYTTANDGNKATFEATAGQTIYFPVSGDNVDFIAYYPQQTLTDGALTIDVRSQSDLPKIDLMAAKVQSNVSSSYNKNQPQVEFKFSHQLTKIELNIAYGTGLTAADLEGLKVEITKQNTTATYTPLTDELTIKVDTEQDVTLATAADGMTAEAILLPEFFDIEGRQLVFTLKATGEKFYWTIPKDKHFNQGDRNIYNITINRTGLQVTSTIEDWNNGNGDNGETGSAE